MKIINENNKRKIFEGNYGYAVIYTDDYNLYNVSINVYDTYKKIFNNLTLPKAYEII